MQQEGHEASIVSFSLQYPGFLFPGKTQYDTGKGPNDLTIHTMINSVNPLNWGKVARHVKQQRPDYVIIRFWLPFMGPALGTIAKKIRKAGIKVIAITDNVIPHEKRAGDRAFTNYFVKQCDGFMVMSHSVLDDLNQFTNNQHKAYSPHPIYDIFGARVSKAEGLEKLGLSANDKHLLFFGLVRKYKGLDLLLEAMGHEAVKALNIKLIVAGEFYDDEAAYCAQIERLGIGNNVIVRNEYIPGEEVRYYFAAADMVVQPYKTATQSGITQIAYHFHKPMLVTNVGGLPEIVPHNKVGYVVPTEANAVAEAIVQFYQENKEETFTQNVVVEKEKYSWSTFVHKIDALVAEIS